MKEIWKPVDIEYYKDEYLVSNLGNIKSLKNNIIMKPSRLYNGYLTIPLTRNGYTTRYTVHRLVATAFIQNPNNMPQINHKNGIRTDNNITNLEWCTAQENIKDAINRNRGRGYIKVGGQPKKVKQYALDGKFIKEWNSIKEVTKQININSGNIVNCCKGKRKTAGKFIWKYCS